MAVIWIIEKRDASRACIADLLIGDHAVRTFASAESFVRLLQINSREAPDCLVIDANLIADDLILRKLNSTISDRLGHVPLCMVGPREICQSVVHAEWRWLHLREVPDGLTLRRQLEQLVPDSQKRMRNGVIKYKELTLDAEKSQVTICPLNENVTLTAKEGRLLRFFLERIGRSLSRKEIQDAVWPGVMVSPRSVDTHISRLRQRLTGTGVEIRSIYGGGYIFR